MAYISNIFRDPCRKDDVVYFTGDTSSESWAGVIGDEYDMTDDQVNDYIKSTKPELFNKLHGMRFSSSDIPLSFKPMRDLRRLDDMDTGRHDRSTNRQKSTASPNESIISKKLGSPIERIRKSISSFVQPSRNVIQLQGLPESDQQHNQDQLKLDGVAQKAVLSAAERLYPNIQPAKTAPPTFRDKNAEPDQAFNYPTNSKQALDRRALKQLEINETLAEVAKYEKALKAAKSQLHQLKIRGQSSDASVLITRPFYMEPREDRYKKQGLTAYDREKYTKALRRDSLSSAPTRVKAKSKKLLFCYCREPDDGREMVRCSRVWCPVAWFHLDCTGLERLPFLNEEFHCCYCADGLGPDALDKLLDKRPNAGSELVKSVAQHYLDKEIETDIIFEEHQERQTKTYAPGRHSIYDDEDDEDGTGIGSDITDDGSWAVEECARLHDKVVKWQAVNDPHHRYKVCGDDLHPANDRASTVTTSFFNDSSDDSQNSEQADLSSDNLTVRASSPTMAMTKSDASFKDNKENDAEYFYEKEDAGMMDSESTAVDSAEEGDDEDESEASESAFYGREMFSTMPVRSPSRSTSTSSSTTELIVLPQPSTITESTRTRIDNKTRQSSSFLTYRNDLPTNFPSFNSSLTGPRTPTLTPQVSPGRSRKPWGTPVNIKDFNPDFGFEYAPVTAPVSPSPDKKRKFEEFDNDGRDSRRAVYCYLADDDEEEEEEQEINDYDDEAGYECESEDQIDEDSEEEGEMVPFMLDSQTA